MDDADANSNTPPEGHLPFNHCDITPEIKEYAARNLNESPEGVAKALEEFRQLLKKEPDIEFSDEDKFLLLFLRSKKFDVKKAYDLLKSGFSYKETYGHLLMRNDPNVLRRVIDGKFIGYLPYRDPKGRAIIYSRADTWDPKEIGADDAIYGGTLAVQAAAHNQVNQILGFVVVLDLHDLKLHQVLAMSRWMIFGTITLQRACPCFMKAFHIINVSPLYKVGWKLVKPLLSEKIRKRFVFHKSSDLSTLYEHIPQKILPKELGGPYSFSNDHWSWNLDNIEKEYYEYFQKTGFKSKKKKHSEIFRQINERLNITP